MTNTEKATSAETIASLIAVLQLADDYKRAYIEGIINGMTLINEPKAVKQQCT